ncbi:MAG: diacylglycerol kinase family protein [Alphaproteobacteria bacterium]
MARLAVISNPRSQRNRRGALAAVKAVVAEHPDVRHEELWDFSDLGPLIVNMIRNDTEVIAVNGGDGTVQAVLTELGRRDLNGKAPKLAVLAGGMTNVIAKDVGLDGDPAKGLKRLLEGDAVSEVERPLIGLALSPEKPPVYGMFFGAAGFYQAVKLANDRVRTHGVAGNLASASTLALSLFRLLFGRADADDPLYRGEPMAIGLDGEAGAEKPYLLMIATTLDRLILGLSPFWDDGTPNANGRTIRNGRAIRNGGTIRYTSVDFPPKRLARALLPVLRGRPKAWMGEGGYHSGAAHDITLDIKSPVVLDGEIFFPDPSQPLRLTADRTQTFLAGTGGRFA